MTNDTDAKDAWEDRLSEYVDDELTTAERHELEQHLAGCASCRRIVDELRAVASQLHSDVIDPAPPDGWRHLAQRLPPRIGTQDVRGAHHWAGFGIAAALFLALLGGMIGGGAVVALDLRAGEGTSFVPGWISHLWRGSGTGNAAVAPSAARNGPMSQAKWERLVQTLETEEQALTEAEAALRSEGGKGDSAFQNAARQLQMRRDRISAALDALGVPPRGPR